MAGCVAEALMPECAMKGVTVLEVHDPGHFLDVVRVIGIWPTGHVAPCGFFIDAEKSSRGRCSGLPSGDQCYELEVGTASKSQHLLVEMQAGRSKANGITYNAAITA